VILRGVCDKARLLDLVRELLLFSEHKSGLAKILGQNHQFLGVNNAIAATLERATRATGARGVFWQTQGSGKSFSMVFYAQKILRTVPGNWTFVVVTDRVELDDQIAKTFAACGAVRGGCDKVPRDERRAPAPAAWREPPLRLHADPQVPDARGAVRSART
jgi:type I restriction enzyme R subunit